jgi:hypothetical protein
MKALRLFYRIFLTRLDVWVRYIGQLVHRWSHDEVFREPQRPFGLPSGVKLDVTGT